MRRVGATEGTTDGSVGLAAGNVRPRRSEHGALLRVHRRLREDLRVHHDLPDGCSIALPVRLSVHGAHPTGMVLELSAVCPLKEG